MITKIRNWILKKVLERRIKKMMEKLEGKKTYILAAVGVVVGLVGVLFGPVEVGPITIPALSWNDFFNILWNGGLFSFLRMGVKK